MSNSEVLNQLYGNISQHTDQLDMVKAWGEFEDAITDIVPDVDVLAAMSSRDAWAEGALAMTRVISLEHVPIRLPSVDLHTPYYRGSGIMIAADKQRVLAVSYSLDSDGKDIVEEHEGYSGYQQVALRKVGRAALLANVLGLPGNCYETLEDILRGSERLSSEAPPHHLGYDFEVPNSGWPLVAGGAARQFTAAGASGMLPSHEIQVAMRETYSDILERDQENGWVDWEHDEFAGFHDLLAANAAISLINAKRSFGYDLSSLAERGVNLH